MTQSPVLKIPDEAMEAIFGKTLYPVKKAIALHTRNIVLEMVKYPIRPTFKQRLLNGTAFWTLDEGLGA